MATAETEKFVQAVIENHGLASGIKPLGTHYDLVAYANISGFVISLADWGRYVAMDHLQASDADLSLMLRADPSHWTWAFRQLSRWRPLLMDGVTAEGLLGPAEFVAARTDAPTASESDSSLLTDAEKDAALDSFIQLLKSRNDLKDLVKAARNQDEVIDLAVAQGFGIDSLTLLRRWSKVSDFSKPTWFGWFDE